MIVNGTAGNDTITVTGLGTGVVVSGLAALVAITNPEMANERLDVNTLGGNDSVSVGGGAQSNIKVFVDGVQA